MDILIVKPHWADRIFDFNKLWEIRGSNTTKRGRIAIAKSGTGCVFGIANIVDSIPLTKELWQANSEKHQVDIPWEDLLKTYKKPYTWILEDSSVEKYSVPIPYTHPQGAVVWVKDDSLS